MQIGRLARAAGVSVRSIRHYEAVGLIGSQRAGNGYRDYEPDAVELVVRIRRMIGLGFSTAEIKRFLPSLIGEASLMTDCVAVTRAHSAKIEQIEHQISDLERRRVKLIDALHSAASQPACFTPKATERTADD